MICLQKLVRVVFKTCSELSLQSGQSWPKKWSDFTLNIGPNSPGKVVRVVLKSGPSCLKSGPSCPVSIISSVQCQYYWYTLHILQFSYPSNLFSYYQVEGRSKKCSEKVFLILFIIELYLSWPIKVQLSPISIRCIVQFIHYQV